MNKTTQNRNNSVKFNVYSLKFKELRRRGRGVRFMLLMAAMVLGSAGTAWGQWTDPNTGVTFTPVSGSTTGSEGYDKGCDGNTGTKHGGQPNALPHYLVVQASEEVKLTGYTITTANDNQQYAGRSPYTWKIQGSNTNNGSDWVDIASVTNDNTIQNVNFTEYVFSCSTDNYYTYFRFYITAINGGNYMQYSEFHPIGEVRPLEPGTSGGGGSTGPTGVGYVITNGSVYLGGTSTTDIGTFNPKTCLWTGTSGSTWRNSAGYYLRYNNGLTLNASNTSNWTLSGTENGNTGQKINQTNQNNRYIRYNYGWTVSNSTNATNAVFAVTKTTYNASYTVPAIGGATVVSSLGSNNINTIATNAAYTQKYYDYIFRNGAHHYVDDNDSTYLISAPSASTFTYTWSLEGISTDYATINDTTGEISYTNSVSSDVVATVKLRATSTKKTFVVTKDVTFKVIQPTSITPSTSSVTVYVGVNGTVTYTLSPTGCYHNVTVGSSTPSVATASCDNAGTVTINPLTTGSTTLTLSAARPGSTALTATVNVTVKSKVATPDITFTPDPSDNTNATATITCATSGYKIYYTKNGGDPTTSSTLYTGAISVVENDVIKAIAVKDPADANWDNSDIASGTYHACSTMAPVISYAQSGTTATVTITAQTGATIYYTYGANPGDPTTTVYDGTGTTSVTISGVTNGQTVKAIAKNGDCSASNVVTKEIITSGVSGGVVTLYDYEDHNWSYYQASANLPDGYPTTYLSSPDPRNVKITYRGVNADDSKPHNTAGNAIDNASAVAISALDGEGQNVMVYYKTLEKSVPGMTGDYPYTVISNPFSKRPATGSGNSKTYYGFAGWKVVSGGNYIYEHSDGQTLSLDETIHFTNLDNNYTPNCTSAEIVFEATWTTATVTRQSSAPTFSGGTYETNFWVLNANPSDAVTVPANCTMTARYPDGTSSWDGNFTQSIIAGGNNAKVEFVNMNSTGNVSAANYTFTMGRGIVNSGNGGQLQGCTRNANCNQTVKIESGKYASLRNFTVALTGTGNSRKTCDQLMILGCDYDRAKGDNLKMTITGTMYVGQSIQLNRTSGSLYVRTYIKSGQFLTGQNISDASANYTYYYSVANTQNLGRRHLEIEGGILKSVAGGIDDGNNATDLAFTYRMRGGKLLGSIYGAAAFAATDGIRQMIFTGGEVNGWIAGGANGVNTDQNLNANSGVLPANTYLYIGGKTEVESTSNTVINSSAGGYVFGAGVGRQALANAAANSGGNTGRVNTSYVAVSDECEIEHDVFAGGNFGFNSVGGNVFIMGGTVHGSVFGGANQNKGVYSKIIMTDGLVEKGIYGGSNSTGTMSSYTNLQINGGQVGTPSVPGNIHGGGYGQPTVITGNVDITLGTTTQTTPGVTVYGNVYGGSALGNVNGTSFDAGKHTNVTMNKGLINGNLFGGAYGNGAVVYGQITVSVTGGTINGNIFGGGDAAAYGNTGWNYPLVNMSGGTATNVFGGGKGSTASVTGNPKVTLSGTAHVTGNVYGGGDEATVTGETSVILRD